MSNSDTNLCNSCLHKDVCKYRNHDFIKGKGINISVSTCPYWVTSDLLNVACLIKKDLGIVTNRLNHLLESDFIRRFDVKDVETGEYIRDISDIDKLFYGCCMETETTKL